MALRPISNPAGEHDDSSAEIMAEINITPLVDVFLVLLIIFMVTSSVMSQMGVNVNLPGASQQTATAQPEGVIITLLPDGKLRLNDREIPAGKLDVLGQQLKAIFSAPGASRLVVLEGDRQAFLGSAIQVMDAAKKAGAERFAIATSPEVTTQK